MRPTLKILASTAFAATMLSTSAWAANVGPVLANQVYSKEGTALQPAATPVTLPQTLITLQAEYTEQDVVTIDVMGPALSSATAPTLVCAPNDVVFGYLGRTGNELTFRVTAVTPNTSTIGLGCTLDGVRTTKDSLAAATSVVVNYEARTAVGGVLFDTGCTGAQCVANTGTIARVLPQFNAVANMSPGLGVYDAVIDVNQNREAFVAPDTSDTTWFTVWADNAANDPTTGANFAPFIFPATALGQAWVLTGNFSWLDANGNGTCTLAEYQAAVAPVSAGAADCTSATFNFVGVGEGVGAITLTPLTGASARVLTAQEWNLNVTHTYDAGANPDVNVPFSVDAGEWTLNGFQATVDYMPFGEGISIIVYAKNSSAQVGEITIDGFNAAGEACSFSAGTMPANSTKVLSADIVAGFTACYGSLQGERVAFDVTINIPASAGGLYTAYNVNGNDRGTVVNSANGAQ
jgi:hypothetical protein